MSATFFAKFDDINEKTKLALTSLEKGIDELYEKNEKTIEEKTETEKDEESLMGYHVYIGKSAFYFKISSLHCRIYVFLAQIVPKIKSINGVRFNQSLETKEHSWHKPISNVFFSSYRSERYSIGMAKIGRKD